MYRQIVVLSIVLRKRVLRYSRLGAGSDREVVGLRLESILVRDVSASTVTKTRN